MEEKEQTNKHGLGSAPSVRKGVCDTSNSPCICTLSRACILRKTSTKATRNANSSLTVFFHCLLLLTVLPLDCYLTPTGLFCPPLSTGLSLSSLGPFFLPPLQVSREISSSGPLCVFRAKTDKGNVWMVPTQTETNCYASCHNIIWKKYICTRRTFDVKGGFL